MPASTPKSKRSELELSNMQIASDFRSLSCVGPRNGLSIDPPSSRGVRSARCFELIPDLTTRGAVVEVPRGFR
eukprot:7477411-Alexandrium_andersonii.AAC.1